MCALSPQNRDHDVPTPTANIKRKAGASLLHSARTADAIGRPLNTFVTVNLWQLGISHEDASAFFQKLREKPFGSWSRYRPRGTLAPRNGSPTHAWVIEAPSGRAHVHWMLHIRPEQADGFAAKLVLWVVRQAGIENIPRGALQIKPVRNAEGLKLYFAKGLQPQLAKLWRIVPTDQGIVHGRRVGTSRNIGPAEWRPRKALHQRRRRATAHSRADSSGGCRQPVDLAREVRSDRLGLVVRKPASHVGHHGPPHPDVPF